MDVQEEPSYPLRYRLLGSHFGEILVKATTKWTDAKEQIAQELGCDSSRMRLIYGGRMPVDEYPIGPPPWMMVQVVMRHMDAVRRERPAENDDPEHTSDVAEQHTEQHAEQHAEQHGEVLMMTMPLNPLRMGVGHLSFISEQWRPRPLFVSMSEESQEGSVGPGVGSALDESIGSIVNELRMGGLGLGGHMQNLTMNIQFEEERPQEPPQDEQQPEPQETSERPTPASASGQSEGRARRRSRIIVRRRERRRRGERAGLSLPMLSAELHTRMQDFASSTSSTLLAAGRALVAAGISLDPAGGSVTLEDETNTSEPTEDPLPRLMQYPIPSLAEVRGLLPWRELYQLETVLEDSLGMDLARQHGQHHWNDFNARFLMVSAAVTLLHHRLQQWLEHMDNVGFIRSYLNAMTLLSAIHARLAVLSAQVFGSLSRSVPPEALEQEWTDDLPLDVDLPQEPAETELPPPLEEATSAEKDVVEEVAPGESVQEIEHGEAEVTRDVKAHSSPVPDPVPSPLREASSCGDAELRAVGVQEAPPLFFQPSPVPRPVTPADFDSALSTLGPGTQTLAKKWLHDPAEFSKKVMKRARCSQHSDSYLSGDWPEPSSNGRLASPEMLLSLNLNKALAKAGCESQAVSSAVREAYILEVLLRIAKKAVTNPDYAEMEATLPNLRMIVDILKR